METVIIGGGAAGCYAAVFSARRGDRVTLLEPNGRVGKKLGITGKGRCNITNNCDFDTLMKNITRNPSFLYSAFSRFGTEECMSFFEELGVPLKTERGGRVFPVSDKAADIVNALDREIKRLGVRVISQRALEISAENNAVTGVKTNRVFFPADKVILATGGVSYPATGSTGDGYEMAKRLGHTVTPLSPSLVPMETEESCGGMAGLTVKNCVFSLLDKKTGKKLFSELGEMCFENYGIGGPLTLSASSYIDKAEKGRYSAVLDLKPALDGKKLDGRILREISAAPSKTVSELMRTLVPQKLVNAVLERAGVPRDKKAAELSKTCRLDIGRALKNFELGIRGFRPIKEAIITDGGISVKEISPSDMQSKIVSGLHFAGEIIDVSGFTGGFNLQIAFATAGAASETD